jgi:hypothetical protein
MLPLEHVLPLEIVRQAHLAIITQKNANLTVKELRHYFMLIQYQKNVLTNVNKDTML